VYEWEKRFSKTREERPDHPVQIKINDNMSKVRTDHCLGIRMRGAQEMHTHE
jgi:hypothetical protein